MLLLLLVAFGSGNGGWSFRRSTDSLEWMLLEPWGDDDPMPRMPRIEEGDDDLDDGDLLMNFKTAEHLTQIRRFLDFGCFFRK